MSKELIERINSAHAMAWWSGVNKLYYCLILGFIMSQGAMAQVSQGLSSQQNIHDHEFGLIKSSTLTLTCAPDVVVGSENDQCLATVSVPKPTFNQDFGTALSFDGTDDYVALQLTESGANSLPSFTAEAWVRTTFSSSGAHDNWAILDFDRSEFFNVFITGDGQLGFSTSANGSGINDMFSGTAGLLNDGAWHHIAAVYDGTDKIAYADGVEIGRVTNAHQGLNIGTSSTRFAIIGDGSEADSFNGARNNNYYLGEIDELRYWETARSITEIASNMSFLLTGTESGLVAYYDFDNGPGSATLTDKASGNAGANDGTLFNMDLSSAWIESITNTFVLSNDYTGSDDASGLYPIGTTTVTWYLSDPGGVVESCTQTVTVNDTQAPVITCSADITLENEIGTCSAQVTVSPPSFEDNCGLGLSFDGSDDYIALQLVESGANSIPLLTLEAWVNTTYDEAGENNNWSIFDFDRSEFFNVYVTGDGRLGFSTSATGSSLNDMYSGSPGLLNDGDWHHIAVVYDGADKIAYADGIEIGRVINAHNGLAVGVNTTRYAMIGDGSESSSFDGARNNVYYDGSIDELRYWHTARTADELNAHMNNTIPPSSVGLVAYYDFENVAGTNTLIDKATALNGSNDGQINNMNTSEAWVNSPVSNILSITNSHTGTEDASGTYPVGSTTVTWTLTDLGGNSVNCSQLITVEDTEAPVFTLCPSDQSIAFNGDCSVTVPDFISMAVAEDNCASITPSSYTQTPTIGSSQSGHFEVTLRVTDGTNMAECHFSVTASNSSDCGDTDGDGTLDMADPDDDNDGLTDLQEELGRSRTGTNDFDGDGIIDSRDIDSDGDGIPDIIEAQASMAYKALSGIDSDGDGIDDVFDLDCTPCGAITGAEIVINDFDQASDGLPDYLDVDTDEDGTLDIAEGHDFDFDGSPDISPIGSDRDGDGLDDAFDADLGTVNTAGADNGLSGPFDFPNTNGGQPNFRDADVTLPIELISFEAKAIGDQDVLITWMTASEINNDYFTIWRSSDGQEWEAIEDVSGAGNSSTMLRYSMIDEDALQGTSYYRLQQTDFDGTNTFHRIAAVKMGHIHELHVYPNPARDQLNVFSSEADEAVLSLYDLTGRQVHVQVNQHANLYQLNLEGLPSGQYLLMFENAGSVEVEIVIISN